MIVINIDKAKEITHDKRREARAGEFKPLDEAITINIANPDKVAQIEADRQMIRDKYVQVQLDIDNATLEQLSVIVKTLIEEK